MFSRFAPGTVLETGNQSQVVIAFFNGQRFEMGSNSQGVVEQDRLKAVKGSVRTLDPVPSSVSLAPIVDSDARAASVRLRTGSDDLMVNVIYPLVGTSVFASDVTLRFQSVESAVKYKVVVEDLMGESVYSIETDQIVLRIPSDILKTGATYDWRVQASNSDGTIAWGGASFRTLSDPEASARQSLKHHTESANDAAYWSLLAEMDQNLGLLWQAREDLLRAVELAGDNPALQEAKREIDGRLSLP